MYTKEVRKQFIDRLKETIDDPIKELTRTSNFSRSTINKFMALKTVRPSTLDSLMQLTHNLIVEKNKSRKELIAAHNRLFQEEVAPDQKD